ncbi:MAG: hypothetical protein ABSC94_27575 [Polyangiaceae bacterium]
MTTIAIVASPPPANHNAPAVLMALRITDPEVLHELEGRPEGDDREGFALRALRIGVLAMRQASGSLDATSIQRESDRMIACVRQVLSEHTSQTTSSVAQLLGQYLDPTTGSLPQRLERLVQRDGELEELLSSHLNGDRSTLAETLARKVGESSPVFKLLSPDSADGVVGTLSRTIDEALSAQRDKVLAQFSLDSPDSALSRLVRDLASANGKLRGDLAADVARLTKSLSFDDESGPFSRFVARVEKAQRSVLDQFSLDCEGSAMRRLASTLDDTRSTVQRSLTLDDKASPLSLLRDELMAAVGAFAESNCQFQSDVRATLATFKVRREEAARSSLHGHTFEYAAGEILLSEAQRAGDVCERLSGSPGREGRKVGDFVLTLGPESPAPGVRIVCECKADKGYTEPKALEEIALARKNRDAQVGIFIAARESAIEGFAPLRRVGMDLLVVWDQEDRMTDVYLAGAISIARALVMQQHASFDRTEGDVRELEQSIRAIERLVTTVEGIAREARLVVRHGTKIGKCAETLRDRLGDEVERLRAVVEGMAAGAQPIVHNNSLNAAAGSVALGSVPLSIKG